MGVAVVRNDFSNPQGGKGVCDRKAATIKGRYVERYTNEGNDVTNALQFKTAIAYSTTLSTMKVYECGEHSMWVPVK